MELEKEPALERNEVMQTPEAELAKLKIELEEKKKELEEKKKELEEKKKELEEKKKELEEKKKELEEKTKLADEYYTQLQYLRADIENLKKFAAKEKMEYIKFANQELVKKLLPVLDSFESALKMKECENKGIIEGMEKIYRQLYEILEKEGLKSISSVGEKFDPFKHEAVAQVENKNTEENTIVEEIQKGYTFNSKVIRTSKVKVSKR